jgi:hypothetical protein
MSPDVAWKVHNSQAARVLYDLVTQGPNVHRLTMHSPQCVVFFSFFIAGGRCGGQPCVPSAEGQPQWPASRGRWVYRSCRPPGKVTTCLLPPSAAKVHLKLQYLQGMLCDVHVRYMRSTACMLYWLAGWRAFLCSIKCSMVSGGSNEPCLAG